MRIVLSSAILAALLLGASAQSMAGNAWVGYGGVDHLHRIIAALHDLMIHHGSIIRNVRCHQDHITRNDHHIGAIHLQESKWIKHFSNQAPTTIYLKFE